MRKFSITVNNKSYVVEIEEIGGVAQQAPQQAPAAPVSAPSKAAVSSDNEKIITAPMPGTVLDIKVSEGESVKAGQVLIILEAMKMENQILAGADGIIDSISVGKGASVNAGDVLVNMR